MKTFNLKRLKETLCERLFVVFEELFLRFRQHSVHGPVESL